MLKHSNWGALRLSKEAEAQQNYKKLGETTGAGLTHSQQKMQ